MAMGIAVFTVEGYNRKTWKITRTIGRRDFLRILPEARAVAFSVIFLMVSTATERVTFKMSVDRMTPYRLSLTMIMITLSFVVYGAIALYKLYFTNKITRRMLEFRTASYFPWLFSILSLSLD